MLNTLDSLDTLNGIDSLRTSDSECDHGSVPADRQSVPPSKRVETDLRARIAANEWKPGERLPPVAELATHYGVARGTVIAAERRIEADGLIEIVPNWGVFRR